MIMSDFHLSNLYLCNIYLDIHVGFVHCKYKLLEKHSQKIKFMNVNFHFKL